MQIVEYTILHYAHSKLDQIVSYKNTQVLHFSEFFSTSNLALPGQSSSTSFKKTNF